jgi:TnpA family transposase
MPLGQMQASSVLPQETKPRVTETLLYVLRRYVNKDGLRAAIAEIANTVLRERDTAIWGEATAVASDSKKLAAFDQNLITEWHIRYRGPGIMVYWHVEKKSLCIYSQIKRCSSSEVAAMIEGIIRHATEMEVQKDYVDSHGQKEAVYAFCYMLSFELLPRLKATGRQKLYRVEAGDLKLYKNLKTIMTKPIKWELNRQYYDEIVKYIMALKLGTAEAEAILSRFAKGGVIHPAYQAILELGKVRKTIFLCKYLSSEELRQEIEEGLNVIENWNSAIDFIWYGKGGEISVNNKEDQEIAILSLHLLQNLYGLYQHAFSAKNSTRKRVAGQVAAGRLPWSDTTFLWTCESIWEIGLNMDERIVIE